MAFYVPLGPRGVVFRLGTMIISVTGAVRYWRAYRRRPALAVEPILVTGF